MPIIKLLKRHEEILKNVNIGKQKILIGLRKKDWVGIKTIAMTRNTITKNGNSTIEERYYISSLDENIKEIVRPIRGHWMVESYH